LVPASRHSLTHRLELGANRAERHFRIRRGDAGGYHHQPIVGPPTRRPLQQFRVGVALLGDFNLKRLAKSFAFHFG
jgi:hypothetical protein